MATKLKITDLNDIYNEADSVDQDLFAEMRSNVLLVSGDHYNKRSSKFWNRIRDNKELSTEQKIRLTKNHIQKISKTYINNILTHAPWVSAVPKNENELADQKAAELHNAVLDDAKQRHKLQAKIHEWASDFVDLGEVAVKIFWDENGGEFKGFEAAMGPDGQPELDENGQYKPSDKAVFGGAFVFERIYGFNLLRPKEAKSISEARCLIVRKMADTKDLLAKFPEGDTRRQYIQATQDQTYMVFDGASGQYNTTKDQTMLREYYFRPSPEFPKGYYYITVPEGVLFEGELPFGIFPIRFTAFDEIPTTPRGRSIIKQLRPYQAEINRAASKMAEHQITLGDDKLLVQKGTNIANGGQVPGVRAIQFTGIAPTILPGRDGAQYLNYMTSQIAEMYDVANIVEDSIEKNGQLDPYAMLFRSLKQKKKFSLYAEKFELFLIEVFETYLALAKEYLPDDALIPAIGSREYINIPEFRKAEKLSYQIKVVPQGDDVETKLGKQLAINHAIQYTAGKLEREDIGKLMRLMPYGNFEESFNDFTIDYDNATNDILMLDRGQIPPINKYDNHTYVIKRLTARMRQKDFDLRDQRIKQGYEMVVQQHEQIIEEQARAQQMAEQGWIPTGGFLVVCDLYVSDPQNPLKTHRARLPYESLQWLIQKLEQQGTSLQQLAMLPEGSRADIAQSLMAGQQPQPGGPMDQGQSLGAGAIHGSNSRSPGLGNAGGGYTNPIPTAGNAVSGPVAI